MSLLSNSRADLTRNTAASLSRNRCIPILSELVKMAKYLQPRKTKSIHNDQQSQVQTHAKLYTCISFHNSFVIIFYSLFSIQNDFFFFLHKGLLIFQEQ